MSSTVRLPTRPLWRALPARLLLIVAALGALAVAPPAAAADAVVGSGTVAADTRRPGEFDAVAVSGGIGLRVRQASAPAATVRGDDNVLPLVETVVEERRHGRTLVVRFARGRSIRTRQPVTVEVDAVRLRAIESVGSGDVVVERFDTPSLELSMSGSGDVALQALRTDALELSLAGSGDVKAEGRAARLSLAIAGSGDADLSGLDSDQVEVSIAGSGDARVVARKAIDVSIAGSGDVSYSGGATQVSTSVAGSGSVRAR
jgi:hypothetical protein